MLEPSGKRYRLIRPITYKDVNVPIGYETDGISYKFRVLGVWLNKFDPLYIEAVIVHDYLTDLGEWEKANKYFEEMLLDTMVAKAMVLGVQVYYKWYIRLLKRG